MNAALRSGGGGVVLQLMYVEGWEGGGGTVVDDVLYL